MAIIPSSTRFVGIAPSVNLTEKKSNQLNSETQPYTMQDIIDTAGSPPAGTTGQIQFNGGSAFAADSNLFWDNTNKNLGIGTSTPLYILDVRKTSGSLDAVFTNTDSTSGITFYQDNNQGRGLRLQTYGSTATGTLLDGTINRANSVVFRTNDNSYPMVFGGFSNSSEKIYFGKTNFTLALDTTTNNVTIGASSGTARLQVKGSGSTSATTSLLVQNSSGNPIFQATDDRTFTTNGLVTRLSSSEVFCGALALNSYSTFATGTGIYSTGTDGKVVIATSRQGALVANYAGALISLLNTDNPKSVLQIASGFTDGNTDNLTGNTLYLTPTYNFSGTALNQVVRGFYYNPTLTSLVNTTHYGIQTTSGGAYINTTTPNASAALQADSTTQGFLPPRMTTAEKLAIATPAAGLQVYDTTLNQMSYYNGSTWVNF